MSFAEKLSRDSFMSLWSGDTLDYVYFRDNTQRLSRKYKAVPGWHSTMGNLENHMVYTSGLFSLVEHPDYPEYLSEGGKRALAMIKGRVGGARRTAARIGQAGIRPSFSPLGHG